MSAQTVTFTGTAGTTLASYTGEGGVSFTKVSSSSTGGAMQLASGETARASSTTSALYLANTSPTSADAPASIVIKLASILSGDQVGVGVRMTVSDNGYLLVPVVGTGVFFVRRDAGGGTVLGSGSGVPVSDGDAFGVVPSGSNFVCYRNGSPITFVTPGAGTTTSTITDATYSATGHHAIFVTATSTPSDSTGAQIDSFTTDIPAAPEMPVAVFDGNSITYSQYGSSGGLTTGQSYPAACLDIIGRTNFTGYNFGVPGQRIDQMRGDAASQIDTLYVSGSRLYFEPSAINDALAGHSDATIQADTAGYITDRIAAGWPAASIYVLAPQAINDNTGYFTTAQIAQVQTQAQWIRGHAATYGYHVVDLATDNFLNDSTNTTYRQADGVHFTDAGYVRLGHLAANGVPDPAAPLITSPVAAYGFSGRFSFGAKH